MPEPCPSTRRRPRDAHSLSVFLTALAAIVCTSCGNRTKKVAPTGYPEVNTNLSGPAQWVRDPVARLPEEPKPDLTDSPILTPEKPPALSVRVELTGRLEVSRVGAGLTPRTARPGTDSAAIRLQPVEATTGNPQSLPLGSKRDGALITYDVGRSTEGVVPVGVRLRMWGPPEAPRQADVRWVTKLESGQAITLRSATRSGEQITFTLAMTILETRAPAPPPPRRSAPKAPTDAPTTQPEPEAPTPMSPPP